MSELTIRSAVPDDAVTICAFVTALEGHVSARSAIPATSEDIRRDMFGPDAVAHAEILERDGKPIGLINWYPVYSTWLGRRGLYVLDIYVDDAERGQCHARRLLSHLAAMARDTGGAFLKLEVDRNNDHAAAVYRHLGFKSSETDPNLLTGDAFEQLAGQSAKGS
jgi:ribosomal protein S18 acetylase RimI-like enzyme